jgi:AraC-like DNA-binding protein
MGDRDPLADVLALLRVRGTIVAHVRAQAPWGLRVAQASGGFFHAVTSGSCWIRLAGHSPRELLPGDVVLLPDGRPHVLASAASGPAQPWQRLANAESRTGAGELLLEGRGGSTQFLCAAYEYDREVAHPLVSLLPEMLVVSGQEPAGGDLVQTTLQLIRHELSRRAAGWGTVIDRLVDVLFVHVIRAWLAGQHDRASSWLRALRDPVVARTLTAMHSEPAAGWTIEVLARQANLSRATLVRRFTGLVGEPPLAYLTRWRMELAARNLRETDEPVKAIGRRVGYTSEFAFSRAFSRLRGEAPGQYRSKARARRESATVRPI